MLRQMYELTTDGGASIQIGPKGLRDTQITVAVNCPQGEPTERLAVQVKLDKIEVGQLIKALENVRDRGLP